MPLLMKWPGTIKPGTTVEKLTQNIDFAPTFLEAAGLPIPSEVQGASLLPLLKDSNTPWRDALYYHYYNHGGDGLKPKGEHGVPRHYGIRTDRYKLIHYYTTDEWELFDFEKDPQELKSEYANPEYAGVLAELRAKLAELSKQYAVPEIEIGKGVTFAPTVTEASSDANE